MTAFHDRSRPRWRLLLIIAAIAAAAMAVISSIGLLVSDRSPTPALPDEARIIAVPGGIAAVSLRHGPFSTADGLASGFSHDEPGAVLAATNLAPRVSAAAGPQVYEPTITFQSFGDPGAALARLRTTLPTEEPAATGTSALCYRVIAGDPDSDQVVVSLLATTAQAQALGGLARVDVALRWEDGDWRIRVPLPRPTVFADRSDYTQLGATS